MLLCQNYIYISNVLCLSYLGFAIHLSHSILRGAKLGLVSLTIFALLILAPSTLSRLRY